MASYAAMHSEREGMHLYYAIDGTVDIGGRVRGMQVALQQIRHVRHAFVYDHGVPALACDRPTVTVLGPEGADEFLPIGPLIVVVTGSRDWADYTLIEQNLDIFWIKELHQGGAPGADTFARFWASRRAVEHHEHRANWTAEGRAAGPRRNKRMYTAAQPDLVIAFKDDFGAKPNGGTEHMVSLALDDKKPVWLVGDGHARWLT